MVCPPLHLINLEKRMTSGLFSLTASNPLQAGSDLAPTISVIFLRFNPRDGIEYHEWVFNAHLFIFTTSCGVFATSFIVAAANVLHQSLITKRHYCVIDDCVRSMDTLCDDVHRGVGQATVFENFISRLTDL